MAALARFLDMSRADIALLIRHRVTLGMLERFAPGDLGLMGVSNAIDKVALVRAAPALVALREFMAEPASATGDLDEDDHALSFP